MPNIRITFTKEDPNSTLEDVADEEHLAGYIVTVDKDEKAFLVVEELIQYLKTGRFQVNE
jgi:nitrogen regulatory protein PII-like uncharacterized protein